MSGTTTVVLDTSQLFPALMFPESAGRKVLRGIVLACWKLVLARPLWEELERRVHERGRRGRLVHTGLFALDSLPGKVDWVSLPDVPGGTYPIHQHDQMIVATAFAARPVKEGTPDGDCFLVHRNAKDFDRAEMRPHFERHGVVPLGVDDALARLAAQPPRATPGRELDWLFADAGL